jgi:hypothetical protein
MTGQLQLQRDTEIFLSTKDLSSGDAHTSMTPSNTWKLEILAGYAASQAAGTQDINSMESGLNPDRSSRRFNINVQPIDWNFQTYLRPSGGENAVAGNVSGGTTTSNARPVADWFLWQALFSNTQPSTGTAEQSAWQTGGKFDLVERAAAANSATHTSNFGSAQENHLYVKMDNVIYQISNAAVESAEVNGAIDGIAMTSWTGKGTNLIELTGSTRNGAVSVFGGVLNTGASVTANANSRAATAVAAYHPWAVSNVQGTQTVASFIKNRLGTVVLTHTTEAGTATSYTFPVTAMSLSVKNNLSYLTPEEMTKLNQPIGQFSGAREITGSVSAYLRADTAGTAQFLRNIAADTRPTFAQTANANIRIGGNAAPYVAFYMPAVQFQIPTHNIEDIISVNMDFKAQEPLASEGYGGELVVFAKK